MISEDPSIPAARRPVDDAPAGDTDTPSRNLLTVTEVAAICRVSKMTIYRMLHSGELSHVRIGNSYRIPENAVDDILKSDPGRP
jgi:excisionase family DNA binding protein